MLFEPSLESFKGALIDVFLQCGQASCVLDGLAHQTDSFLSFREFNKLCGTVFDGTLLGFIEHRLRLYSLVFLLLILTILQLQVLVKLDLVFILFILGECVVERAAIETEEVGVYFATLLRAVATHTAAQTKELLEC